MTPAERKALRRWDLAVKRFNRAIEQPAAWITDQRWLAMERSDSVQVRSFVRLFPREASWVVNAYLTGNGR